MKSRSKTLANFQIFTATIYALQNSSPLPYTEHKASLGLNQCWFVLCFLFCWFSWHWNPTFLFNLSTNHIYPKIPKKAIASNWCVKFTMSRVRLRPCSSIRPALRRAAVERLQWSWQSLRLPFSTRLSLSRSLSLRISSSLSSSRQWSSPSWSLSCVRRIQRVWHWPIWYLLGLLSNSRFIICMYCSCFCYRMPVPSPLANLNMAFDVVFLGFFLVYMYIRLSFALSLGFL